MKEEEKGSEFPIMLPNKRPLLEDVVGTAKTFIDDFGVYSRNKKVFENMGVSPPSTFLLEGEAGTGKTMAIHALNNHYNRKISQSMQEGKNIDIDKYKLCVVEYSIGRHGTAYINMGSRKVQSFFDKAGVVAKFGIPVLVFLDECDSLMTSRRSNLQSHGEDRKVLETIMKNLQTAHDTDNMYVALTTNLKEQLDEASIRAGRIDARYKFSLPTDKERYVAINKFIHNFNEKAKYKVIRNYNVESLVEATKGFNYADIEQGIRDSVATKATYLARTKKKGVLPSGYVTQKGLLNALQTHKNNFKGVSRRKNKIGF